MTYLSLPSRKSRQPLGAINIADEFLRRGAVFANTGMSAATSSKNFFSPSASSCSLAWTQDGLGLSFSGSTTYARFDTQYTFSAGSECSVEFIVYGSSFPSLSSLVASSVVSQTDGKVSSAATDNGSLRGVLAFGGTAPCNLYSWAGDNDYDSGVKFETNKKQHVVVTKSAGTGSCAIAFYVNGLQVANGNSSNVLAFATSGPYFYIGGKHHSAPAVSITGVIPLSVFYSRALSIGEVVDRFAYPYAIFNSVKRRSYFWDTSSGAQSVTGTLAATDGADLAALSGAQAFIGTLSATDGVDLAAFAGSSITGVEGTLAATDGADLAAFAGAQAFTGTLAATDGADLAAFAGAQAFTGTLAATDGADLAAFAGAQAFTGTLAATDGADLAAFAGSSITGVDGALAATDGADDAAFSGLHTITVTGSIAATDGADGAAFAGLVANPVAGTISAIDGADDASFVGAHTIAVTGTFAVTDGADAAYFVGSTAGNVVGTLSAADGADAASFVGALPTPAGELSGEALTAYYGTLGVAISVELLGLGMIVRGSLRQRDIYPELNLYAQTRLEEYFVQGWV